MLNSAKKDYCFALFDNWAQIYGANFIIALSGGGDSLALTLLLQKWRESRKNDAKIRACIIDHGIAQNSDTVASEALRRANSIGVEGEIIRLNQKIERSIQETARNLRYSEIFNFAAKHNSKLVLLGHNQGDQIETILFRMLRNTGIEGLSAMSNAQLVFRNGLGSFLIARPLLSMTRDELRGFLKSESIDYFDDPANTSNKFARVKVRDFIKNNNTLDIDCITRIGESAAQYRNTVNIIAHDFLAKCALFEEKQIIVKNYFNLPTFIKPKVLEIIIQAFNYPKYRPETEKIERLLSRGFEKPQTLGGVKIIKSKTVLKFSLAPPRRSAIITNSYPNQAIIDAICNYCS